MADSNHVIQALLLTFMGAAGTALGGLMVVIQPHMSFHRLGVLQGLAAGLMLSISLLDLLPEAVEEIGAVTGNGCFYLGVLFFAAVVYFIPEPDASMVVEARRPSDPSSSTSKSKSVSSTTTPAARTRGAAAAAEAAATADVSNGPSQSETEQKEEKDSRQKRRAVLMSGLITAVGIALHNFPEGVAIFLASHKSPAIGVSLAAAIALHNIPEGVAVALPVYFATGSRWRGFKLAFLSGLAEPLAVVVVGLLFPVDLPKQLVDCMLAAVGGIMAFLSFHELLPLSIQHAGKHAAIAALFAGMGIMSLNLHLLNTYVLQGLH